MDRNDLCTLPPSSAAEESDSGGRTGVGASRVLSESVVFEPATVEACQRDYAAARGRRSGEPESAPESRTTARRPANTVGVRGAASRGRVRRLSEGERVLGQAERGEVRIGPEAAREIAARHEAAYGPAFAG